jgi:hypothetical protein
MVHLIRGIRSIFKKRHTLKIASFAIIAILLFSSLYVLGSLFTTPSDQSSGNGTTMTLAMHQSKDYTHGDVMYEFKYAPGSERNLLQVYTNKQTPINYPAVPGTTYELTNIKFTIQTANEQTLTIHITP